MVIGRQLLDIILQNARVAYPRETILLLRGKAKKNRLEITDIIIPPLATHGEGFSGFPTYMLPMDFSLVGSVHSHPSGNATPSVEDLNHYFGRVMMIVAYPFLGENNVAIYDRSGERATLTLKD